MTDDRHVMEFVCPSYTLENFIYVKSHKYKDLHLP